MKKPVALCVMDLHMTPKKQNTINSITQQLINRCKEYGLNKIICGGDVFHSREQMPQENLLMFVNFLNKLKQENIEFICIPGNHDKLDYDSEDSWLDLFEHFPNFKLFRKEVAIYEENITMCLLPYFKEDGSYTNRLKTIAEIAKKTKNKTVLISHIAISGARNNDGSLIKNEIPLSLFNSFDLVLIGHYHNRQEISDKIIYPGAPYSNNFGEDNNKGFVLLYDNATFDYLPTKFTGHKTINLNVDTVDLKQLNKILSIYKKQSETENVRVVFEGSREKINSLPKDKINTMPFKAEYEKTSEIEEKKEDDIRYKKFSRSDIKKEWPGFANKMSYNKYIKEEISKIL